MVLEITGVSLSSLSCLVVVYSSYMEKSISKLTIHKVLAYSYTIHSVFFLIGIILDQVWHQTFTYEPYGSSFGFLFLVIATALVFWAQYTSRVTKYIRSKIHFRTPHMFAKGPYKVLKSPTNLGLMILMIGFGFLMNSVVVILMALLSYIISQWTFIRKQQELLKEKYGDHYVEYTENVKL